MTSLRRGLQVLGFATALAVGSGQGIASADDSVPSTIQQVIQRSSDQQSQAIATRNMSLMADTQTDAYFKQLSATFQNMLDNQVTGVTLLKLDFGPIDVAADGKSAMATTWETWRITSQVGSIDYDPVRNDYALVLDNGTWKINSDVQTLNAPTPTVGPPTSTPTPTSPPTPTSTPTPAPTVQPTATPTVVEVAPASGDEAAPAGDEAAPPTDEDTPPGRDGGAAE